MDVAETTGETEMAAAITMSETITTITATGRIGTIRGETITGTTGTRGACGTRRT
jgi:hypothetical protein